MESRHHVRTAPRPQPVTDRWAGKPGKCFQIFPLMTIRISTGLSRSPQGRVPSCPPGATALTCHGMLFCALRTEADPPAWGLRCPPTRSLSIYDVVGHQRNENCSRGFLVAPEGEPSTSSWRKKLPPPRRPREPGCPNPVRNRQARNGGGRRFAGSKRRSPGPSREIMSH